VVTLEAEICHDVVIPTTPVILSLKLNSEFRLYRTNSTEDISHNMSSMTRPSYPVLFARISALDQFLTPDNYYLPCRNHPLRPVSSVQSPAYDSKQYDRKHTSRPFYNICWSQDTCYTLLQYTMQPQDMDPLLRAVVLGTPLGFINTCCFFYSI
jgi:hypothetical protein